MVYFDGIVVHVRGTNGRVAQHTVYVALAVNLEGRKELLGLWLGENEGAKFWLACLTDFKNRGLNDIFVACIDGLSGFPEAIRAAYRQIADGLRNRRQGGQSVPVKTIGLEGRWRMVRSFGFFPSRRLNR